MNSKQMNFFGKRSLEHGGRLGKGKRKTIRPLTHAKPIHVVLRSSKARGRLSLLNHSRKIDRILAEKGYKFGVKIYEKANSGNHLHMVIRGRKRSGIQQFFRSITCLIARKITGARRGKKFGKFWDHPIYTRVLSSWTRDFKGVRDYLVQNALETLGLIPYTPRSRRGNTS